MAKVKKDTAERGLFKENIHAALYKSSGIRELLLGDLSGKKTSEIMKEFREHVKSHLFIDDTIMETASFIYYDVIMPRLSSNTKTCQVTLYAICHRDILDDYAKEGYHGNRADVLSQMIEDALINSEVNKDFGIGPMNLVSVYPYNSRQMYGVQMIFEVPNFR
jgi:hypothetical protein